MEPRRRTEDWQTAAMNSFPPRTRDSNHRSRCARSDDKTLPARLADGFSNVHSRTAARCRVDQFGLRATILLGVTLLLAPLALANFGPQEPDQKPTQNVARSAVPGVQLDSGSTAGTGSGSQPAAGAPSADSTSRSSTAVPPPDLGYPFTPGPDYVIGLGDVLHISVWKEPEFSSTVQVRSDGMISLPLLNDVQAVGYKPMDLAAFLATKLARYVDDPRVTIILSQARPPVFYMVGEVGHRGPMALAPNMTVLQALLTAGLSTYANPKKIYVLRTENGVERKFPVNYKRMVKGMSTNQNILLKAGDMVVVP